MFGHRLFGNAWKSAWKCLDIKSKIIDFIDENLEIIEFFESAWKCLD
jgi:hypothetical protein